MVKWLSRNGRHTGGFAIPSRAAHSRPAAKHVASVHFEKSLRLPSARPPKKQAAPAVAPTHCPRRQRPPSLRFSSKVMRVQTICHKKRPRSPTERYPGNVGRPVLASQPQAAQAGVLAATQGPFLGNRHTQSLAQTQLPSGPTDWLAVQKDWALVHRKALQKAMPGGLERLQSLFQRGLDVTTHYSGTGAAEQSLFAIMKAAGFGNRSISVHSTCDIDPKCLEILEAHPAETRACHSFDDIMSNVPGPILTRFRSHCVFPSFPFLAGRPAHRWGGG